MKKLPQNELLSAYLDGELSAEDRARVEQWLTKDATARKTLDALRAVGASLKGLPTHQLDEDLSQRVLRAAEQQILAEPTRLADAPRPAAQAEALSVRRLARRLFSLRGLAWSGLAVAIAILLMVFQTEPPGPGSDVAIAPEASKSDDAAPALVAADEARAEPAEGESDTLSRGAYPANDPVRLRVAESGIQPAREPAAEHLAKKESFGEPEPLHGTKRGHVGDERRPAAAKKTAPTAPKRLLADTYGGQRSAGKARPGIAGPAALPSDTIATKTKAPAYKSARIAPKGRAMAESPKADTDPFEGAQNEFEAALRTPRPPAGPTPAGTAVQRAVRNQAGVPIVSCVLSTKALKKDAFTRILVANAIDVIKVSPGDEQLAQQLLAESVRLSARADQRQAWYVDAARRETQTRAGDTQLRSKVPAMPPASADQAGRPKRLQRKLAPDVRQSRDAFLTLQEGGAAKVVLVEGSERQIAATLAQLTQRKDMNVSIPPQPRGVLTTAGGRWFQEVVDGQRRAQETSKAAPSSLYSRKSGESKPTQEALPGLAQQTTPTQQLLVLNGRGRGQQRGTAQVLGIVRLDDQALTTGSSLSFLQSSAPKRADQPVATKAGAPASPAIAAPGSLAADRPAKKEKQSTPSKGIGGMGAMGSSAGQKGGAGMGGTGVDAKQTDTRFGYESGSLHGLDKKAATPAEAPPGALKADESKKQKELVRKLLDRFQRALKPADHEAGQPLRQVLFVIQTVPDRPLAAAVAAPVEAEVKQKQEAAKSTEKPD